VRYGREKPEHIGTVTYLQRGGFGLNGQRSYPQGTTLKLVLIPAPGQEIELGGEVAWVRDYSHLVSMGESCEIGVRPHDVPGEYLALVEGKNGVRERRKHARYPDVLEVAFDDMEEFVKQYTENISRGGLYLRSDSPLEVGHVFKARLVVPDVLKTVTFQGEVVHVARQEEEGETTYGLGIKFREMSAEDTALLARHVERLQERFSF